MTPVAANFVRPYHFALTEGEGDREDRQFNQD